MFRLMYDTYWNRMFALVARKVKDRDDVLDIMQNIFFHLWIYRDALTRQNAESIMVKTYVQEISNFYSHKKKQPPIIGLKQVQLPDESDYQLQIVLEKEQKLETLRININRLPISRKKILTMNKIEGITQEKIANNLNLSTRAVKKQISKALIFLRQHQNNS